MKKDYYQILAVGHKASKSEINKAYKKLAFLYHPDKNLKRDTEEIFKEINEAYDVLHSSLKRRKYDDEINKTKRRPVRKRVNKTVKSRKTRYRHDVNNESSDDVAYDFLNKVFGSANASRFKNKVKKSPSLKLNFTISLEDAFFGGEKLLFLDGKKIRIPVEPGIEDGQILKIKGAGYTGLGQKGDLHVTVNIAKDQVFARKGSDLFCNVILDIFTALLGGFVEIDTFAGKLKVGIPECIRHGQKIKVRKKGMPVYGSSKLIGDLIINIIIHNPVTISEKEKKIITNWKKIHYKL